jgi:hypothetical protein
MSREIPLDQPLTDEDRTYLRQRGAYGTALEARVDASYPPDADALAAYELSERKAAAAMNGAGLTTGDQTSLLAENDRLRAELAMLKREQPADEQLEDYSGWSKAELEAEIDRVNEADSSANLAKGKVDEMKTALMGYFSE